MHINTLWDSRAGTDGSWRWQHTHRLSSGDRLSVKKEQFWLSISANLNTHVNTKEPHTHTHTHTSGGMNHFRAWMACSKLHSKLPSNVSESRLAGLCSASVWVVNTSTKAESGTLIKMLHPCRIPAIRELAGLQTERMRSLGLRERFSYCWRSADSRILHAAPSAVSQPSQRETAAAGKWTLNDLCRDKFEDRKYEIAHRICCAVAGLRVNGREVPAQA